jgi:hypothetical protein
MAICHATSGTGAICTGQRLVKTAPPANISAVVRIAATPGSLPQSADAPPAARVPAISSVTPERPSASPASRRHVGRSPSTGQASTVAQTGMV